MNISVQFTAMTAANEQNTSFLLERTPGELLDEPLSIYSQLLRESDELENDHLEAIDYVVRHTVVRLLVRAAEEAELEAACSAIRRLVPVARETQLAAWLPRWRAFADLLEARMAVLANQDTAKARELAHAGEILAFVQREPGLTQAEIGKQLELKPANLSRILGVLEAQELIERRNVGRERRVHPGRMLKTEPQAKTADGLKRGAAYLQVEAEVA